MIPRETRQDSADNTSSVEYGENNPHQWKKWLIDIRPCNNIDHNTTAARETVRVEDIHEHDNRSYDQDIQLYEPMTYSYAPQPYHWNFYYHDRHDRKARHHKYRQVTAL